MIPIAWIFRAVGTMSRTSRVMTVLVVMLWVSTTGDSAVTLMVSSTLPVSSSTLTVAVKSETSSIPSRLSVLNPGNENDTV